MKKIFAAVAIATVAIAFSACSSAQGKPGEIGSVKLAETTTAYRPDIIDYKGAEFGKAPVDWINTYIDGDIAAVEKLDMMKNKYAIVVETEGKDKEAVMMALANLKAPVEIAGRISTRVQQRFAGAQVGDQDKIETYMENVVKVAREASFSGFTKEGETWVYLQYYKPGKPKTADKAVYRGYQLWSIDKDLLQQQINAMLNAADKTEPAKTEEKQAAIDRVKAAFYEGF